jgi:hypothetical protein
MAFINLAVGLPGAPSRLASSSAVMSMSELVIGIMEKSAGRGFGACRIDSVMDSVPGAGRLASSGSICGSPVLLLSSASVCASVAGSAFVE